MGYFSSKNDFFTCFPQSLGLFQHSFYGSIMNQFQNFFCSAILPKMLPFQTFFLNELFSLNHFFDFHTKNLIFRSEVEKHSFVNPHVQFLVCLQHIKISEMAESEQFEKKMKYACFLNIFYWKFWTPLVAEPKMGDHQKHLLFDRLLDGNCLDTKKDHSNYCSFPDLKRAYPPPPLPSPVTTTRYSKVADSVKIGRQKYVLRVNPPKKFSPCTFLKFIFSSPFIEGM